MISSEVQIPPALGGVTLLALGNGAPDISSAITAISAGGQKTKLGFGALIGAAMFDITIVTGLIAIICDKPTVARRPFLRDCIFLLVATLFVLFITRYVYCLYLLMLSCSNSVCVKVMVLLQCMVRLE